MVDLRCACKMSTYCTTILPRSEPWQTLAIRGENSCGNPEAQRVRHLLVPALSKSYLVFCTNACRGPIPSMSNLPLAQNRPNWFAIAHVSLCDDSASDNPVWTNRLQRG